MFLRGVRRFEKLLFSELLRYRSNRVSSGDRSRCPDRFIVHAYTARRLNSKA
jgi:hypothetical protein